MKESMKDVLVICEDCHKDIYITKETVNCPYCEHKVSDTMKKHLEEAPPNNQTVNSVADTPTINLEKPNILDDKDFVTHPKTLFANSKPKPEKPLSASVSCGNCGNLIAISKESLNCPYCNGNFKAEAVDRVLESYVKGPTITMITPLLGNVRKYTSKGSRTITKKRHTGRILVLATVLFMGFLLYQSYKETVSSLDSFMTFGTGDSTYSTSGSGIPTPVADTLPTRDNSTAIATTLYSGTFTVGTDISPGRYVITGDGMGNFFNHSDTGSLKTNEILDNSGEWGVSSITTDLNTNDKIEISGLNSVYFNPATTELRSSLSTGTWLVGLDISAGSYNVIPANGSGNLMIFDENGDIYVNEILDVSAEFGVQKVAVDIKNGDFVLIIGLDEVRFENR